jgi:hypothetical protein
MLELASCLFFHKNELGFCSLQSEIVVAKTGFEYSWAPLACKE